MKWNLNLVMKVMLIPIILIPSLLIILPLYHITYPFSNYLWWVEHINDYKCNCPPNSLCSCPIDTASSCANLYHSNLNFFNSMCTTTRWDDPYWIIQITAIILSLIPTFVSVGVLSVLYYKSKKKPKVTN
jgi:hypothetical protein